MNPKTIFFFLTRSPAAFAARAQESVVVYFQGHYYPDTLLPYICTHVYRVFITAPWENTIYDFEVKGILYQRHDEILILRSFDNDTKVDIKKGHKST